MQFLEGAREHGGCIFEAIKKDARRRGVLTLLQQVHSQREFSTWSMGFKKLDSDTLPDVPGYSDFLDRPLTSEQFLMDPSKALRLLLNFKNTIL